MRFLLISLLGLALFLPGCRHAKPVAPPEEKEPDVKVRVQPAEMRTIAETVTGLGHCEALPEQFAILTASAEGKVVRHLKQPGEIVKAGDPIVELDRTLAAKNLKEKEASFDVLQSLPRAEEQTSAKLAIEQAQVALDKARMTAEHLRPLRERGEISEAAMSDAESALHQAELQLKSAKAQYDVLMLRPRPQAIAEVQSRIDTAKAQLDQLTIRSPIAGVLNGLTCQLGQTLSVGTAVGEVVDARRVNVVVWLSVADAQRIKAGQAAEISPCDSKNADESNDEEKDKNPSKETEKSKDDDKGKAEVKETIEGKVTFVGIVADPQTGNLPVRILVDNADGKLTLGEAVSAAIVVHEEKDLLAVPVEAIQEVAEDPVVSVVRSGKSAELHPKLGLKDAHWIAVAGTDLKPGEPVIIEGGYNLPNNTPVGVETPGSAENKE